MKQALRPCNKITIVEDKSLISPNHIHIDEPLISSSNREAGSGVNLQLGDGEPKRLYDDSDDNHGIFVNKLNEDNLNEGVTHSNVLEIENVIGIHFHRTLRMPDDDKLHQLPASLGHFPLYNVSEFENRLPENIVRKGGVFLPIWSREALWMSFTPRLIRNICALRVYVGNINAVTGEKMGREVVEERKQDYVVVPGQQ